MYNFTTEKNKRSYMQERKKKIYNELFKQVCSKQYLAEKFSVTTKTIENAIKTCDDIVYSKKLGAYHFRDLMPSYISYQNYFDLFKDNLANPILKKDMIKSINSLGQDLNSIMVETKQLSDLSKKIIRLNIAINHNCVVKLSYKRGDELNRKIYYIRPNSIITAEYIYYLYLTYDKKDKNSGVEKRPFAFNGINDIEQVEYTKDNTFRTNKIGNSFGTLEEANKQVTLKLTGRSANFFKREGLFNNPYYRFISEESNGDIEMIMTYNHKIEVIKLVQQWLPYIFIADNSSEAEEIIRGIEKHCQIFFDGVEV